MKRLLTSLASESVLLLGLVSTLCVALGISELWMKVVLAATPLVLALMVRMITTNPEGVASAIEQAATETAQNLTVKTVGPAGEVTEPGTNVVTGVIDSVLGTIGGLVPSLTGRK